MAMPTVRVGMAVIRGHLGMPAIRVHFGIPLNIPTMGCCAPRCRKRSIENGEEIECRGTEGEKITDFLLNLSPNRVFKKRKSQFQSVVRAENLNLFSGANRVSSKSEFMCERECGVWCIALL